eukprot:1151884-Pelagomonas_calceolata.AAC.2
MRIGRVVIHAPRHPDSPPPGSHLRAPSDPPPRSPLYAKSMSVVNDSGFFPVAKSKCLAWEEQGKNHASRHNFLIIRSTRVTRGYKG